MKDSQQSRDKALTHLDFTSARMLAVSWHEIPRWTGAVNETICIDSKVGRILTSSIDVTAGTQPPAPAEGHWDVTKSPRLP